MAGRKQSADHIRAIGVLAPVVISARLQMLGLELMKPTAAGRRETIDMIAEKPLALMLAGMAIQAEMVRQAIGFWQNLLVPQAWSARDCEALAAAALAPVARQVRANARRLTR
ncbi:hypothetical protein [Propylenella binzhouense]|uniref:Uncharacterized protein n=1 Tax=Propylenella binzhouense TaxID=2555902 RepID=A0A964WSZ2_9HYPH|nr:hypothetical protein [Propylenella binzhouense]MYZ47479.1 hypothetical protein [Propylenella binzhouense]